MAKNISKNREGYGYKYTDLAQIHNYLEENDMSYYQYVQTEEGEDYVYTVPIIGGEEKPARRGCRVVQAILSGKSNPAQEQGSALTYARRYSLLMAFGLATEDDDAASLTISPDKAKQMLEGLKGLLEKKGIPVEFVARMWKVDSIDKLTVTQINSTTKNIDNALKKYKKEVEKDGIQE